jgi:hypothetical protein
MSIPDDMLLRVLRKPVTRVNAEVTLLAEYAASAADRIEALKRQLREAERDARDDAKSASAEAVWRERQGDEYGS